MLQVRVLLDAILHERRSLVCILQFSFVRMHSGRMVGYHETLLIAVCAPKGILREVKKVIYADTRMTKDLEVLRESIAPIPDSTGEKFVFDIQKPNLMYGYAIEWIFGEPNDSAT